MGGSRQRSEPIVLKGAANPFYPSFVHIARVTSHEVAGDVAQNFWQQNGGAIETLATYGAGILVYALAVNFFYQIISKRVMFGAREKDGQVSVGGPLHGFLYLIFFPLFSFGFFLLLSVSLIFLGGSDQDLAVTFTLAMAVVLAVRVSAYFSEATSHDVAKMLPLGLLGVILVRAEFADFQASVARLATIADFADLVALYFGIVVIVEYLLRTIYLVLKIIRNDKKPPTPQSAPPRTADANRLPGHEFR